MAQLQVCRRSLLPSIPSVQRGNGDRKLPESSLPRSLPLVLGRDEMIWGVLLQSEGLAWCLGWGERISAQILLVFWVKTTKTKKKKSFFFFKRRRETKQSLLLQNSEVPSKPGAGHGI